jgi:putative phage-type endonuclease
VTVVALRQPTGIGGSEAAAAAGIDPYRSRTMLWLEKSGRFERPESDAMRWGTLLEPVIRAELARQGFEPSATVAELTDSDRPWLRGTPDGFATLRGETALLEIKTVGAFAHRGDQWDADAIPIAYAAQIQHYLHLTGLGRCLLAVLVGGQRLETREVARDDRAIAGLLALEEQFWTEYLVPDRQPPVGAHDRDTVNFLHPTVTPGRVVRLDREHYGLLAELHARRAQLAAIEAQKDELENRLKDFMGDAETALSPNDDEVLRWSSYTARRIDSAALKASRPDVYDAFAVAKPSRRFNVL